MTLSSGHQKWRRRMPFITEKLARALHESYCLDQACGQDGRRAQVPWEDLPESYRQANRASVNDLHRKLNIIGWTLVDEGSAVDCSLDPGELEQLAELEHERWCDERIRSGWLWGELRNEEKKWHPDLVPYAELSERSRQLDRDKVLRLLELLANEGFVPMKTVESDYKA